MLFLYAISVIILKLCIAANSTESTYNGTHFYERSSYGMDASKCCSCPKSYLIGLPRVVFFDALVLCHQIGMELASPMSAAEQSAIEDAWNEIGPAVGGELGIWIAGTRYGSNSADFTWITTGKPVVYRKFLQSQPDNARGKESCLEVVYSGNGRFGWNDLNCDEFKLGFVCQTRCCCS